MAAQLRGWGGWAWKTFINPAKSHRSYALKVDHAKEAAEGQVNFTPRLLGYSSFTLLLSTFLLLQGPTPEVDGRNAQLQAGSPASGFPAKGSEHISSVAVADDARTSLVAGEATFSPARAFLADFVATVAQHTDGPEVTAAAAFPVVKTSPLTRQGTYISGSTVRVGCCLFSMFRVFHTGHSTHTVYGLHRAKLALQLPNLLATDNSLPRTSARFVQL